MEATLDHLVNLFRGVRDVRDAMRQYCLGYDENKPDIWHLEMGFEQVYGKKIRRIKVPGGALRLVRGIHLLFENEVVILLDGDMSDHTERYISTKELCHLILKDKEYMTPDPAALIETMLHDADGRIEGMAPWDYVSDSWTRHAAIELLFPFSQRIAQKEKLDTPGGPTIFSLAQSYEVPDYAIESAYHPPHHEMCAEAWGKIGV